MSSNPRMRERPVDPKTAALLKAIPVLQRIVDQWGCPDIKEILDECNAAVAAVPLPNSNRPTLHLPI